MEKIVFKKYNEKHRKELNTWIKKEQILGGNGFNNFVVSKGTELGDYLSFINDEMDDMKCFVALKNTSMVGFFVLSFHGQTAHVEICGINPDFRGQGLMNEILTKLSSTLKKEGIERITLSVNNKNETGLKSFSKIARRVEGACKKSYSLLEI